MARTTQTEADLGLGPTPEEMAVVDDRPEIDASADTPPDTEQPAQDSAPAETAVTEKPQEESPGTVDIRALQEARGELREARQQNAVIMQRLNEVLGVIAQPAKAAEAEKPQELPKDDPLAILNFLVDRVTKQDQTQQEANRQTQEREQHQQSLSRLGNIENEFRATAPDYDNAIKFVAESRDRELQTLFPYSTPEQRQQTIALEWKNIVDNSFANGQNPAALVYALARTRGYAAPTTSPPAPKPLDPAAVADAQQRHQSLSDASGGEAATPLDAKALAKMTDKQFRDWMGKRGNDKRMDAILGG